MTSGYVLQSIKKPDLAYEILSFDPATKVAQLRSYETGVQFEETLTKEFLQQFNYRVMKGDANGKPTGLQT